MEDNNAIDFIEVLQSIQTQLEILNTRVQSLSIKEDRNEVLSVPQAAQFLNLTVGALRAKINRKAIPYSKTGKRIMFLRTSLIDWLKSNSVYTIGETESFANEHIVNYKKNKL